MKRAKIEWGKQKETGKKGGNKSIDNTSKRKGKPKLSDRMSNLSDVCPKVCFIVFVFMSFSVILMIHLCLKKMEWQEKEMGREKNKGREGKRN